MSRYRKGDLVEIRDYPFGRALRAPGVVGGVLGGDYYNVKMLSGLCEGKIIQYKYWVLKSKSRDSES